MTIHHCPKCELRFDWKTEVDDHCWHDHPEFRHAYPARTTVHDEPAKRPARATPRERHHADATELFAWLQPASPREGVRRSSGR